MTDYRGTGQCAFACPSRQRKNSSIVILAISLLLFVDVRLPFIGSSNVLLALLILILLLFGRSAASVSTPFCLSVAFLTPIYFLLPVLVRPALAHDTYSFVSATVFQMVMIGAMILLAQVLSEEHSRRQLIDTLIVFALISAAVAILQRNGVLGNFGKSWRASLIGDMQKADYSFIWRSGMQELRGSAFMADPNLLAVTLASIVPLALAWRFERLRWPAIVLLGLGIYATDSRTGLILGILALLLSIFVRKSSGGGARRASGRKATVAVIVSVCLIAMFALDVGGQRTRVFDGLLIGAGISDVSASSSDHASALSARKRRELALAYFEVGKEELPFGAGLPANDIVNERVNLDTGGHNVFFVTMAQGGIVGLLIGFIILLCLAYFIRRRREPFAKMGIVIIFSSVFIAGVGTPLLVLPMGLADGIRAAHPGSKGRPERLSAARVAMSK